MSRACLRCCILVPAIFSLAAYSVQPAQPILEYIHHTWDTLTRGHHDLAGAAVDPKLAPEPQGKWPVYTAPEELERVTQHLDGELSSQDLQKIDIRPLPLDLSEIQEHGLLYLPYPYVVPGGRFNEMYGWDSFFIQMGLLRDDRLPLAKALADNFLYEIRDYGKILNANRTYYLTRSQPPFLTQMLLAVYARTRDRQWLEDALPEIEAYYRYWTSEPHLTKATGLSRYFDSGDGPAPEVVAAERDATGHNEYEIARQYFRTHRVVDYDVAEYFDAKKDELLPPFYKGDRSMRESGFDPSRRFGPFGVDIIHYDPVCLNSLLYLMESQTAEIMDALDRHADAVTWRRRAEVRADAINRLMWSPPDGLYYDYNFDHRHVRRYPFLTTFYPLWAGIASRAQAAHVMKNLALFERPGGLVTSTERTGDQWDSPFGWAPLQWIAVEGMRRYGYRIEADRISEHFLTLMLREYRRSRTIDEKYDVVHGTAQVSAIKFGYHSNEAGFGWTNAVFVTLLNELPPAAQRTVLTSR